MSFLESLTTKINKGFDEIDDAFEDERPDTSWIAKADNQPQAPIPRSYVILQKLVRGVHP